MIETARQIAADWLQSNGKLDDAGIVARGQGDDFPEVRVALATLTKTAGDLEIQRRALHCYADPTFWESDLAGGSLAFHDHGEIAQGALDGKEMYALHRD